MSQALDAHCLPIRRSHRVKGRQGRALQEAEEHNDKLSPSSDWLRRAWLLEERGGEMCGGGAVCEDMQRKKNEKLF